MKTFYKAGSLFIPGTRMNSNVTGDCSHKHRTIEGARRCIAATDAAIKRGHGPNCYCDRIVVECEDTGSAFGGRRWVVPLE